MSNGKDFDKPEERGRETVGERMEDTRGRMDDIRTEGAGAAKRKRDERKKDGDGEKGEKDKRRQVRGAAHFSQIKKKIQKWLC